jgi:hypothetical protein
MLTLSIEELIEITGKKQKKKMKEWLARQGIHFLSEPDGWPRVSRELIQEALKGNVQIKPQTPKRGNSNALRELMSMK